MNCKLPTATCPKYWQSSDMKKRVIVAISRVWKKMAEYHRRTRMGLSGRSEAY